MTFWIIFRRSSFFSSEQFFELMHLLIVHHNGSLTRAIWPNSTTVQFVLSRWHYKNVSFCNSVFKDVFYIRIWSDFLTTFKSIDIVIKLLEVNWNENGTIWKNEKKNRSNRTNRAIKWATSKSDSKRLVKLRMNYEFCMWNWWIVFCREHVTFTSIVVVI